LEDFPVVPRRARCANQLGENGRKPGFIIGEFGSFREFVRCGPGAPAGLIHRLSTVNLLGGVWEFDNPP